MSMTIQERMALQMKIASASKPAPAPPPAPSPSAASASDRIRQQLETVQASKSQAPAIPPADTNGKPAVSAAERIARQVEITEAQKKEQARSATNDAILAELMENYGKWQADMLEKIKSSDPEFYEKLMARKDINALMSKTTDSPPIHPVNGISTAEGEMLITAPPSQPIPGLPYQATPVIPTNPSPGTGGRRRTRSRKASPAKDSA